VGGLGTLRAVLELQDVSLFVGRGERIQPILSDVCARLPKRHLAAIIGPSGCGKSTLLKTIAGIVEGEEEGAIFWESRDLTRHDFAPSEIGYVPQFSIAHDELTASESVETAVRLRMRGIRGGELRVLVEGTLHEVGLRDLADRRVGVLSGGQKRRLALAMEIASAPSLLLCDEVTSGLDAQAEDEIFRLLDALARRDRLVLLVTHSLRHLELCDSVMVLTGGALAYHGPPGQLAHYFSIDNLEDLYARLDDRPATDWDRSWRKHSQAYASEMLAMAAADDGTPNEEFAPPLLPVAADELAGELADESDEAVRKALGAIPEFADLAPPRESATISVPGAASQFVTLVGRRFRIFARSRGQLLLQLGLILGFPILVAIFAWNGLPEIRNLSVGRDLDVARQFTESLEFLKQSSKVGSLVSGIVMFQVILLTLMGANNAGREIAAERLIFEKEKLSGLRASSYVASKAVFLAVLVAAQSLWMGLFVHFVCQFPGSLGAQLLFLLLVNAAMTSICLGISSWMATAEQASLVSIYLVGFQLPLSGAVLALPSLIGSAVRPFISAYWSWSGVLQTLRDERTYDIVVTVVQTGLSPAALCIWVLSAHVVAGLFLAWCGCRVGRMR